MSYVYGTIPNAFELAARNINFYVFFLQNLSIHGALRLNILKTGQVIVQNLYRKYRNWSQDYSQGGGRFF